MNGPPHGFDGFHALLTSAFFDRTHPADNLSANETYRITNHSENRTGPSLHVGEVDNLTLTVRLNEGIDPRSHFAASIRLGNGLQIVEGNASYLGALTASAIRLRIQIVATAVTDSYAVAYAGDEMIGEVGRIPLTIR